MEIRYFQIIIPLLAFLLIFIQERDYLRGKSSIYETGLISFSWISVAILSLFPDYFSDLIAKVFGIKDNINAILFFAIGLLFYFQLQLFKMLKKQDELLTELTRKIALDNAEKE